MASLYQVENELWRKKEEQGKLEKKNLEGEK